MENKIDHDDIGYNDTPNEQFSDILEKRISRRGLLRGGAASAATVVLGTVGLSACGGSNSNPGPVTNPEPPVPSEKLLAFTAVGKSLADSVVVPAGYTATVMYALGDPLTASTAAYKNDGTDSDFENRAGDHHDGMEFFGLDAAGKPSANGNARGLLAMNHEATTNDKLSSFFIHANGGTNTLPRPAAEVDRETALHGISVVEVRKASTGKWEYVKDSVYNRRVTCLTDCDINGPAKGSALMKTKYSKDGTKTRGTLNNCGTGVTPWGSFVTGEENWSGYFFRGAADDAARGDKSVAALKRYGRNQGSASRHGWETGGADDKYARWNNSKLGASIDGTDDYRNEMNGMGYIVEADPYNKTRALRKRTALGRYAHESAAFGKTMVGQPLAVYMGDDSRNEYIYKFVSTATWIAGDAAPADLLATGDKYLDSGKLFVAKFAADGTGTWIELSINNTAIANYATYKFADQADVLVNARLAADAVGATKMDRPEWCSVSPTTGEVYFTLTNNSARTAPDGPNPRMYEDMKGSSKQTGNVNGHILRVKEKDGNASAAFSWDVYLFGSQSDANAGMVNLSSLTADQDFSSPDGLAFSKATGICWIQTDDGAYTDATNCMMLAGVPGQVGDGKKVSLAYGSSTVDTFVGKTPTADTLKRFLVGPVDCELTGIAETPDGKTLFVNIQHPGEGTSQANLADPTKYSSQWPANAGYGSGKRPRSATIAITKNDGGRIGT